MFDHLDDWFTTEVLSLEAMLMRYLRQNWRDSAEWPDLRREVYARVYEAARARLRCRYSSAGGPSRRRRRQSVSPT